MVLRTAFVVLGILFALGLLGVGAMAAFGISLEVDFSSPGPIKTTDRPELEVKREATVPAATSEARFKFGN